MAVGPNLLRRGAVYHWRKRLPRSLVPFMGCSHLCMSLNTKDPREARHLGVHLDAIAMNLFSAASTEAMSKAQLAELFRTAHVQHKAKLGMLADIERSAPTSERSELLAMEMARGEAYALLAAQGAAAQLDRPGEQRLRDKGYDTESIIRMLQELEALRDGDRIRLSMAKLAGLIEATGAPANAGNIARATPIYLRAIAEALLTAPGRYGVVPADALDFASLLKEAQQERHSEAAVAPGVSAQPPPAQMDPVVAKAVQPPSPPADAEDADAIDGSVRVIGDKLVAKKINGKANAGLRAEPGKENEARGKAKGWDKKAVRQAESIFDLFDRFLVEEYGFNDLTKLRQKHLSEFEEFLRQLNRNFGKSPKDKARTIAELRSIAAETAHKVGSLLPGTLNRHLTYLGQLIRHAKATGVTIHPDLSTGELRSEQTDRGRDQRPVPAQTDVEKLFHEPPFTGCADWDKPEKPGDQIWHGALYYGTLLGLYEGLRREEFCGLDVDDVVDDAPHPYLIIRFNDIRRIKNVSSVRFLAIHSEVIRLGFLDYVRAMRALGHKRLFEDLYSPTTNSPLGDRYYKQLQPSLRNANVTPHQLRHYFNNALKQKEVTKEFRADLLGHMGEGETDERYADPVEIKLQLELLARLPVLTAHLEQAPLKLLPWIERREAAPFSRPNRKK